jgi:hypothetical protein
VPPGASRWEEKSGLAAASRAAGAAMDSGFRGGTSHLGVGPLRRDAISSVQRTMDQWCFTCHGTGPTLCPYDRTRLRLSPRQPKMQNGSYRIEYRYFSPFYLIALSEYQFLLLICLSCNPEIKHAPVALILTACLLSLITRLLSLMSPRRARSPFSPPPWALCSSPQRRSPLFSNEAAEARRHGRRAVEELLLLEVVTLAFLLEYATTKLQSAGKAAQGGTVDERPRSSSSRSPRSPSSSSTPPPSSGAWRRRRRVELATAAASQCKASSTCCPRSASVRSMCTHAAKEPAATPRTSTASVTTCSFITSCRKRQRRRSTRKRRWNGEEAKNGASVRGRDIWMNTQFTVYYSNMGMGHEFS